jgi:hypothetical protein
LAAAVLIYIVKTLLEVAREAEVSTARGDDHQIHHNHHPVVASAICAGFALEPCVPDKYFLLDRPQHHQDQAAGGPLRKHACDYSRRTGEFSRAE